MKRLLCLVLCTLLLSTGGCAPKQVSEPEPAQPLEAKEEMEPTLDDPREIPASAFATLDELLDHTNARHAAVLRPELDLNTFVASFEMEEFDLTPYQQEREYDPDLPLTPEQLIHDLDVLHSVLRSHYPAYYHFGGREVFDPLFAEMIADAQAAEPDTLTAQSSMSYISWYLGPVIRDFHFTVNQASINPPILPYRIGDRDFMRTDDGSYVEMESGRQVASVSGIPRLDELFRLAIAENGTIVYWPILVEYHEYAPPEAVTVTFEDGSAEEWTPHTIQSGFYGDLDDSASLEYREDVPVIHTTGMGFEYGDAHRPFLDCLEPVQEEPLLVVDLRSNGGGNTILPLQWLEKYAGQPVPSNAITITTLTDDIYRMDPQSQFYVSYETSQRYISLVALNERYNTYQQKPDETVSNSDRLLVVLTGKSTASAAETFVETAYNLENTLFVGTNTSGGQLTGSFWIVLPESGVQVGIPRNLTLYQDGFLPEFRGVEPDLWMEGDAEELALRMLEYLGQ